MHLPVHTAPQLSITHVHMYTCIHTCTLFLLSFSSGVGKFYDNAGIAEPEVIQFPGNERVVDVQTGSGYILALTESGSVYTWGKNSSTSYEVCNTQLYHYDG